MNLFEFIVTRFYREYHVYIDRLNNKSLRAYFSSIGIRTH